MSVLPHRSPWQVHHVLPRQLHTVPELGPFLGYARLGGFCFEDPAHNGILLPANDWDAAATGLPLHRGPHSQYDRHVRQYLTEIARPIAPNFQDEADAAIAAGICRITVRAIRAQLSTARRCGTHIRIDDLAVTLPMARGSILEQIERVRAKKGPKR